jgi:hypothetical protein
MSAHNKSSQSLSHSKLARLITNMSRILLYNVSLRDSPTKMYEIMILDITCVIN